MTPANPRNPRNHAAPVAPARKACDHAAAADAWIAAHPAAFDLFLRFARERADRGKAFGGKALAERVRWEHAETIEHEEGELALNNNHVAYIVRAMLRREPRLARFCRLREVDSTEEVPHAVAVDEIGSTPASGASHARIDTRAPAPAHPGVGASTGEAREPAGTGGREPARNGKSGGSTVPDRRAENPRHKRPATVPAAARSSPGTLFDSAPAPRAGWRHA